jgi:DNA-nicking Smr family endonuclease
MPNKYEQTAEAEIDLHGYTMVEAGSILDEVVAEAAYKHIRIITGKGTNSHNGPVLPAFVKNYLTARNIRYNQSKIRDGGEGALEVFLR